MMPDSHPIEKNPIYRQNKFLEADIRNCFENRNPVAVLASGPPGLGKSYTTQRVFHECMPGDFITHRPSYSMLMQRLSEDPDGIYIFDDYDEALQDTKLLALFKAALDSKTVRIIEHGVQGRTNVPPFRITAGIIFLTNLDINDSSLWSRKHWNTYIEPLKQRLGPACHRFSFNKRDVYEYTSWLAPHILSGISMRMRTVNQQRHLTEKQQEEIIKHFREHGSLYAKVAPRVLWSLGRMRLMYPDDDKWNERRDYYLNVLEKEKQAEDERQDALREAAATGGAGSKARDKPQLLPKKPRPPHTQRR